jgi:hypothetical protein
VHVAGGLDKRPGRSAFRYQNNWQLPLNGPGEAAAPSRQTAQATARKLRALARERQGVRVGFDRNPSEAFLRRVVALNRAKIEAQGRRHGIDEAEFGRLRAISAELGHGAALTEGDTLIAGDLICIADNRAYFLTGGYEPDFQRFSPGMITLSHAIEACRRRGILDFNLLWGDGRLQAAPRRPLPAAGHDREPPLAGDAPAPGLSWRAVPLRLAAPQAGAQADAHAPQGARAGEARRRRQGRPAVRPRVAVHPPPLPGILQPFAWLRIAALLL